MSWIVLGMQYGLVVVGIALTLTLVVFAGWMIGGIIGLIMTHGEAPGGDEDEDEEDENNGGYRRNP